MSSVLEAIEASVVAETQLVVGMAPNAVRAVSVADMFQENQDGTMDLNRAVMPDDYPGAIVAISDDEIQESGVRQYNNTTSVYYRPPVIVAVFARSDGAVEGDARKKAFEIGEATQRRLMVFRPSGLPANASAAMLEPGPFRHRSIDAHTHAVVLLFIAPYQIVG